LLGRPVRLGLKAKKGENWSTGGQCQCSPEPCARSGMADRSHPGSDAQDPRRSWAGSLVDGPQSLCPWGLEPHVSEGRVYPNPNVFGPLSSLSGPGHDHGSGLVLPGRWLSRCVCSDLVRDIERPRCWLVRLSSRAVHIAGVRRCVQRALQCPYSADDLVGESHPEPPKPDRE
jgi:hypothetical protein